MRGESLVVVVCFECVCTSKGVGKRELRRLCVGGYGHFFAYGGDRWQLRGNREGGDGREVVSSLRTRSASCVPITFAIFTACRLVPKKEAIEETGGEVVDDEKPSPLDARRRSPHIVR